MCAELNTRLPKASETLIKVIHPFERLNVDFKGPLSYFGMLFYVHADRETWLMFEEIQSSLAEKGIATRRTTPNNGEVEWMNEIVWEAITLGLKLKGHAVSQCELVPLDALHSVRSLMCTATNATPQERFFSYSRNLGLINITIYFLALISAITWQVYQATIICGTLHHRNGKPSWKLCFKLLGEDTSRLPTCIFLWEL